MSSCETPPPIGMPAGRCAVIRAPRSLIRSPPNRVLVAVSCIVATLSVAADGPAVLDPAAFAHHIERFNAMDGEAVTTMVTNADAWAWLRRHIPFFECPDSEVEEIYYFRWWSFRKHLKRTGDGFVFTEFLTPVSHAGIHNTISCAAGFHLAEGRWLRDGRYVDDYTRFWLRGNGGRPQPHFHRFSSWFAAAVWDRYLANGDRRFVINLIEDLAADYRLWERERQLPSGLFWQHDVKDGMEESISGSRTAKNIRPTINSYMVADARAIAANARLAGTPELAAAFDQRAVKLRKLSVDALWDGDASFFKVRCEDGQLSDAREAIGYVPWMFGLPEPHHGLEVAWRQLKDPRGFAAPFGITTAERRHPRFRSHGHGTCEWDGAVWPFATSQTLYALANVLRDYPQDFVNERDYFDVFLTYVHCHRANGTPYIGEYLDEVTGDWIDGTNGRSRFYNHSTFADVVITGLIGLRPRADDLVNVHPLVPVPVWDWFCIDAVPYHGRMLTILWDRNGSRYGRGAGLRILAGGREIAGTENLQPLTGTLP